jgi:5'-nucleotidase/UDP-sugar diphosphatase
MATFRLTILHTNDQHGRFWKNEDGEYGMAARKTLIDQIRGEVRSQGEHCLLLSGGDVNSGVPESDRQYGEPDFRGMRHCGSF